MMMMSFICNKLKNYTVYHAISFIQCIFQNGWDVVDLINKINKL